MLQTGAHLQYTRLHLEAQGSLVAVAHEMKTQGTMPAVTRGKVLGFSKASRLRMMRRVARLDVNSCVFMTLTYPARHPDPMTAKNHLRALLERIRRRYPDSSAIWKLEPQERGAPHFHLLFFSLPFLPFATLRQWWNEIICYYVDDNLARVRIEWVRSRRGVMRYCAKYTAKDVGSGFFIYDAYLHAGRFWGIFNRAKLPTAQRFYVIIEQVDCSAQQVIMQFLKTIWDGIDEKSNKGAVVFTEDAYRVYGDLLHCAMNNKTIGSLVEWRG